MIHSDSQISEEKRLLGSLLRQRTELRPDVEVTYPVNTDRQW